MTPRRIEQLLWIVTILVAIAGAASASVTQPHPEPPSAPPTIRRAGDAQKSIASPINVSEWTREIVAGDVFRRERSLTNSVISLPRPTAPAPPKPRLVLRGLVGGPPWNAILEGVPGHDGSYVVSVGDSVGGLKIRSVHPNGVVIRGMDTTWNLKFGAERSP